MRTLLARLLAAPLLRMVRAYTAADAAPFCPDHPHGDCPAYPAWIAARIAAERDPARRTAWRLIAHTHTCTGDPA